jgi:hypothetical protein
MTLATAGAGTGFPVTGRALILCHRTLVATPSHFKVCPERNLLLWGKK